ncbi:hydroxyacid dehydrogenase [bacterium]|nr:hydroxyacid dehydrogenase [bacterium]
MDIYFYEAFEEEVVALKEQMGSEITAEFTGKTIQEADHKSPPAQLISVRTQSIIPLEWAGQISGILSRSTGYDHLARYLAHADTLLPCAHLPLYCHRSVAEQALLLWMALLRRLPRQMAQLKDFNRDGLTGLECQGKNLLVVGVGQIGSEIVKIGQGMGMHVTGHDIIEKYDFVEYVDLRTGLEHADIVVCAMNLTNDNYGYFNASTLRQAMPGLLFVNIARGEISPTADLLELLDTGHLGGVGLDVFENESRIAVAWREDAITAESELLKKLINHPLTICTPHNAFNTLEAVNRKSEHSAMQVRYFLEKGRWLWPIPPQTEDK